MLLFSIRNSGLACVFFGAMLMLPSVSEAARGVPAGEGIGNFGKISDGFYRGAQPDAVGIQSLQRLGIKSIIDLRMSEEGWKAEPTEAQARGILYTNVPFHGFGRPTDTQVQQVLALLETLPGPVFIHCKHGCDRTGTIVASYRIAHDKWSNEKAMAEAIRYGFSRFERGMKRFIAEFGKSAK